MTIKEVIDAATGGAASALESQLVAEEAAHPEWKPAIDPILAALNSDFGADNIKALLTALPPELSDIAKLHFNPTPHAGDAT